MTLDQTECQSPDDAARAVDIGGTGWFVGITSTPIETLGRHGVNIASKECRVQRCASTRVARAALRLLVRRNYHPTVASLDGCWIYVYRIEPWTVEDTADVEGVGMEIVVLAETPFSSTGHAWAEHVRAADDRQLHVLGLAAKDIAATEPPFDLIVRGEPAMRYRGCGPARPAPEGEGVLVSFETAEAV
ncbi:MAG: hypothetical protein RIF41_01920 [Polyangiaceae bacterium]